MLPGLDRNPTIIKRLESTTDPSLGCAPKDRSVEHALRFSFINVNKPKGPTSHQIAEYVKNITKQEKAGHGGTLDPGVTGVLPVGLNDAVKVIRSFLLAGKEYVCYMKLHKLVAENEIRETMNEFVGQIRQLPPLKSAVKREWRTRRVYYIDIIEIDGTDVLFKVGCEAGTYIRKLCTDIGEKIGGAHMQQLVRTRSAKFSLDTAVTLQDVADAVKYANEGKPEFLRNMLISVEDAIDYLPKIWITDAAVSTVTHGAVLAAPGVVQFDDDIAKNKLVAVVSLKGELVALGKALIDAHKLKTIQTGQIIQLERVIMDRSVYTATNK